MEFHTLNNISVESQKVIFWYNNGTYNLTDASHVFDLTTGTVEQTQNFLYYPKNTTLNETVKFSIFGNHSTDFKQLIDQIYVRAYRNETNYPIQDIAYSVVTIDDNYVINWSMSPSSNNASNHRQFEIKIPKVELEGYDSMGELGVIVGGYGTMSYTDECDGVKL